MSDRSLLYKWPEIYKIGLKMIPGKKYDEKYRHIAEMIDECKNVLEVACGPALLPKYLKNDCNYRGFDINERFIKHAKKNGHDVWLGNAMNFDSYYESEVVVICDAMHHVGVLNEIEVISNALKSAKKKIIICEPYKDFYLSLCPSWIPGGKKFMEWWFNFIEKDGSNLVDIHKHRSKKELKELMMTGYGVIENNYKRNLTEIGENYIVTYHIK